MYFRLTYTRHVDRVIVSEVIFLISPLLNPSLFHTILLFRFDEEGKGLGIEEKFEVHDTQLGYVQGYKDRDTYDFKMLGVTREKSGLNLTSSKLSPQLLRRPISSGSNRS